MDVFDAIRAEKAELDTLIEQGMTFEVPKRSLLRFIGKSKRTFLISQPYLGTLDRLSAEFIQMSFSEDKLKADPIGESKRLMHQNARRCAKVVAIAILNSSWKIRLLSGLLARYLLWRITPQQLFNLTMIINRISNMADFTNSIRFLSISNRTTAPGLIEETKTEAVKRD